MGEANELAHLLGFVRDVPLEGDERIDARVGPFVEDAARGDARSSPFHEQADEGGDDSAGRRVVGEGGANNGVEGGVPARTLNASFHALCQFEVGFDEADRLAEPQLQVIRGDDVEWYLAVRVRLEHGGEETFDRAVVHIGYVLERFFRCAGRCEFGHEAGLGRVAVGARFFRCAGRCEFGHGFVRGHD